MGISETLGIKKISKERTFSQRVIDQSPSRAEEFKQKLKAAAMSGARATGSAIKSGVSATGKFAAKELSKQFKEQVKPKIRYVRVAKSKGKRRTVVVRQKVQQQQPENNYLDNKSPNLFGENSKRKSKRMELI